MNYKLACAMNELELIQMEMEGIDYTLKDPTNSELEKYPWELRRRVLELGEMMLQNLIARQIESSAIEDILKIDNLLNEVKK